MTLAGLDAQTNVRTTAKDLIAALRRHHEPPPSKPIGGYFVAEIQAPHSTRRADALWLPVNTAARGQIHGYETKVSRSDVVQEIRDPMKADAWQKYCDYWWLVIPSTAIIDGLDIPDEWGVMTPPATGRRTMTVVRKAPRLNPQDPRSALGTVLAKLVYGGDSMQHRMQAAENTEKWLNERLAASQAELRQLRLITDDEAVSGGRVKVGEVLTHLERLSNDTVSWLALLDVDAAAVAGAILAAAESAGYVRDARRAIDRTITDAERQVSELKKIRAAIA